MDNPNGVTWQSPGLRGEARAAATLGEVGKREPPARRWLGNRKTTSSRRAKSPHLISVEPQLRVVSTPQDGEFAQTPGAHENIVHPL